jgi:hypothetical protein
MLQKAEAAPRMHIALGLMEVDYAKKSPLKRAKVLEIKV